MYEFVWDVLGPHCCLRFCRARLAGCIQREPATQKSLNWAEKYQQTDQWLHDGCMMVHEIVRYVVERYMMVFHVFSPRFSPHFLRGLELCEFQSAQSWDLRSTLRSTLGSGWALATLKVAE